MRQFLKFIPLAFWLTTAVVSCTHSAPTPIAEEAEVSMKDWNQFTDQFLEHLWQMDPDWAMTLGHVKYRDKIVIPDASYRQAYLSFAKQSRDTLAQIPRDKLPPAAQTDWLLLDDFLSLNIWQIEVLKTPTWNPASFNLSPSIAHLFESRGISEEDKLRSASLRFDSAEAYYAAARASITDPTREHTALALTQHKGITEYWRTTYLSRLDSSRLSETEKQVFRQRMESAIASVRHHIQWLETMEAKLAKGGARSFRLSPELYRQKFAHELGASSGPDEIYSRATAARESTLEKMDQLAVQLYPKYFNSAPPKDRFTRIKSLMSKLSENHPDAKDFRQTIEAQLPQLVTFVKTKNLVRLDPSKPLVVRDTPLYARGVAGASIDAPGPYDKTADTFYNVSPLEDYGAEKVRSYLREYNTYTLQILNIHEAIPGHYVQLLHANESPSLIKSIFGNGTMIEGWAVYAERMMLEEGYGGSPELWLMYYKWHLRVILNTILDYEIHMKNLSREGALTLLTRDGFQEQAEAEEKWKRATLTQVQLASYFTGYSETYSLREEIKARQGAQFNLLTFHNQFLSYGSAPIKYIRRLLLAL